MRILKWSNKQLCARLKLAHEMNIRIIGELKKTQELLTKCREWTAQREALVATPTIQEIAATVQGGELPRRIQ